MEGETFFRGTWNSLMVFPDCPRTQYFRQIYLTAYLSVFTKAVATWQVENIKKWKKRPETQTLRAGCSKAETKNFASPQTPFPGAQDDQNLISWRWSLPLPTNPVWWGSMHAISSYRDNRPTNTHPQTHKQTHRQDRLQYTAPQCIVILARSVTGKPYRWWAFIRDGHAYIRRKSVFIFAWIRKKNNRTVEFREFFYVG